jgi:malonyl-CoA decarboxylase
VNNRFLRNLFRSFSENVGGLLDRLGPAKTEKKDILQLAETLISGRGEASDVAVAREFLATYDGLTEDAVLSFLALLDRQFGPDQERLERALRNLQEKPTAKAAREMYEAAGDWSSSGGSILLPAERKGSCRCGRMSCAACPPTRN